MSEPIPESEILELARAALAYDLSRAGGGTLGEQLATKSRYEMELERVESAFNRSRDEIEALIRVRMPAVQLRDTVAKMQSRIDELEGRFAELNSTISQIKNNRAENGEPRDNDEPFAQIYETTIFSADGKSAFKFVSIPRRSVAIEVRDLLSGSENGIKRILTLLEVDESTLEIIQVEDLFHAVSKLLNEGDQNVNGEDLADFARFITYGRTIPFENSPLNLESLASIPKKYGPGGIGTVIGLIALSQPLILLTVPAGIVICGLAIGIAKLAEDPKFWGRITGKERSRRKR